jgi:hypothetical protein
MPAQAGIQPWSLVVDRKILDSRFAGITGFEIRKLQNTSP